MSRTHERSWGQGTVRLVRPGKWRAWRARVRLPDGTSQRPSRTFTGADAERRAKAWAGGDVMPDVLLVGHWLDQWLALRTPRLRPFTVRAYRRHIANAGPLALRPLAEVTTDEIQAQANALLRRFTRSDVVNWRACLSSAFLAATARRLRPDNPLVGVQLPKAIDAPVKAWSAEEVQRLAEAARGSPHEAWLWLALGTGGRMGELRALERTDVDLRDRTVTYSKSLSPYTDELGPTKNGKTRVVAIPEEALALVVAHLARLPAREQRVFASPHRRGPYRPTTYCAWIATLCAVAAARPLTPHATRHTFATLALDAGVPLKEVSEDLGHADVAITAKIYSHAVRKQRRGAASALGQVLSGRPPAPLREIGSANGTRKSR